MRNAAYNLGEPYNKIEDAMKTLWCSHGSSYPRSQETMYPSSFDLAATVREVCFVGEIRRVVTDLFDQGMMVKEWPTHNRQTPPLR